MPVEAEAFPSRDVTSSDSQSPTELPATVPVEARKGKVKFIMNKREQYFKLCLCVKRKQEKKCDAERKELFYRFFKTFFHQKIIEFYKQKLKFITN